MRQMSPGLLVSRRDSGLRAVLQGVQVGQVRFFLMCWALNGCKQSEDELNRRCEANMPQSINWKEQPGSLTITVLI